MLAFVKYGFAVLDLGLGHYRDAITYATNNHRDNPFLSIVGFAILIEAACRRGEHTVAAAAAQEYAARASTGTINPRSVNKSPGPPLARS